MSDGDHPQDPIGPPLNEMDDVDEPRIPISFWVMVVLVAVYLGWRLVQLIGYVISWITG